MTISPLSISKVMKAGMLAVFVVLGFASLPSTTLASGHYEWTRDETCYENYDRQQDMWVTDCYYSEWYQVWVEDPAPPPEPEPQPQPPTTPPPPPDPIPFEEDTSGSGYGTWEGCQYDAWNMRWNCVQVGADAASVIYDTYNRDMTEWYDGRIPYDRMPVLEDRGGGELYYNSFFCGQYWLKYVAPTACTTTNACGVTSSGWLINGGSCSATQAALPSYYGQSCSVASPANACGQTTANSGTYNCSGTCSASAPAAPAVPSYYGQSCSFTSAPNACGQTNTNYGSYGCSGACSVSTPASPANPYLYGQGCSLTSAPNACGQTNTTYGTYGCSSTCGAPAPVTPSNASCNAAPTIPTFSYLYSADASSYIGASAPAYTAGGYRVYMNASDPNGDNVAIYYQLYDAQTGVIFQTGWSTPTWVGSGGWTYTLGLQNANPGTYYVQAYSYDGALTSSWSAWQPIYLTTPTMTASCSVNPTSGSTSTTYTWMATASGGSGTGYSYVWSGTGLDGKTGSSVTSNYTTGGEYTGSVRVTDSVGNTTGSVTCSIPPDNDVDVTPAPTATLSPSTQTVILGQRASFTWTSTNATSCQDVATPPAFANGPTSGSGMTGALSSNSSYQIRCTGPSGIGYSNLATVNVVQPAAYITAVPKRVKKNTATNVSWSAQNVTNCSVSGTDGYSSGALSGPTIASTTVARTITAPTTFTFSCPAQGLTSSVTVDVLPEFVEF